MKYPRVKRADDKRIKIFFRQIKQIIDLRSKELSHRQIAKLVKVSKTSVGLYLNLERKLKQLKQRAKKDYSRWRNDLLFKQSLRAKKLKSINERRKTDKKFVQYNKIKCLERYYKNKNV